MDGFDSLPDENTKTREYRDEPACACLQSEACYEHRGHQALNIGDTGIASVFALQNL